MRYFSELTESFGRGWNRFWFTPADPLPLCALRVLAGLLLLYSHASYTYDLDRFFGADGLLPVDTIRRLRVLEGELEPENRLPLSFSYLYLAQSPGALWGMHIAGFVVIAAFTAGVFTRLSTVLALVVALSYLHRAPILAGEFDRVLVMVLCYLCLAPCGAEWSVDAWLKRRGSNQPATPEWTANIAIRLLQVHLCVIFAMMAVAKLSGPNPPAVWWTGEGVWWLLAKPETRPFDLTGIARLRESQLLFDALTHAVVWFELLYSVFIWIRLARPLVLGLLVLAWAPIIGLATGLFPFVAILVAANLAFVSGETLRSLSRPRDAAAPSPALAAA